MAHFFFLVISDDDLIRVFSCFFFPKILVFLTPGVLKTQWIPGLFQVPSHGPWRRCHQAAGVFVVEKTQQPTEIAIKRYAQ